eukprot:CAMPEP_0174705024 /NCGR_PEP_ID=MMETSP1094-20130205/8398_1 /TAXON_ID=156173 /ORGANISM="Chrysochromulina brevifilum, Strain UTEX LB 985" /LENGTH=515 /DNA_ID=CAMNT_0015903139 /DNA_START=110 /DNA_END=1654 /DNA_ORIENTATION=+
MTDGDGKEKKIGVWGMVVVGFFWVHGGIYGNEAMLMAGPPLYVFIMLGIVPFVYSLPIALIVAELSTAFPEDGGYVVWVQEACGKVIGSHHAYWVWVIYVVDAAIYPVLVANYIDTMWPMNDTQRGLLAVAIVLGVTVINLCGTDVMVKFNTVLAIVSLAPTLMFTAMGLPTVSLKRCLATEGDVDWTLLVSWILWLYCGFFSLGTMAGELKEPRRTFSLSIAILFPAVLLLNTLPLAVALGLDDRLEHYSAGYFNVLAGRLAGVWLDSGFQIGANVCLVGLYNAAVLTAERSLFFLVNTQYGDALDTWVAERAAAGGTGRILQTLLSTSQTGVAPLYILTNAACAAVLVWMPYTLLVEFSMLLSVPSILLFMWSFVALRVQRPHVDRPFLIPGGLPVAVLITVIPVAISIAYAAIITTESSFQDEASSEQRSRSSNGGLPPIFQVISMLGIIGMGLLVHGVVVLIERRRQGQALRLSASGFSSDRYPGVTKAAVMAPRARRGPSGVGGGQEQGT